MLSIAFVYTNQVTLSPQPDCRLLKSKGLFLSQDLAQGFTYNKILVTAMMDTD